MIQNIDSLPVIKQWEPKIVAFFCNWCTYTAADLAGVSRIKHAANIRVIRVMCSGAGESIPSLFLILSQKELTVY